MFSGLKIADGRAAALPLKTSKSGLLLAYLAFQHDQPQERRTLAEWLWPDVPLEKARGNLRVTLLRLRGELNAAGFPSEALFEENTRQISIRPASVQTDVGAYQAAQSAALRTTDPALCRTHLAAAAALYTGPFLPDFDNAWADQQRSIFAESQCRILKQLIDLCEVENDRAAAIGYARDILRLERCDEEAACRLMRLLLHAGQYNEAVRVFKRLTDHLQKDLQLGPSPEARLLAQQARQRSSIPLSEIPTTTKYTPSFSPDSIPHPLTRFFGREVEIARITSLLAYGGRRLLTLTGLGGSGKTRLAIEAAQQLRGQWKGRVFFVELAGLTDAAFLLETVAYTVQPTANLSGSPRTHLKRVLGTHPTLLVLDNFEHLLAAGRADVLSLMQQIPTLTLLVTSRERLQIQGETALPTAPLPVPDPTAETPEMADSMRLFLDRAQTADPDFALDTENTARVAAICLRLEGIPLALELAAAWLSSLTLPELQEKLERRFDVLVSPYHDTPARHRALRKTLEWSYEQLSPDLQRVFLRLAAFRGGWTAEAAGAVCETPDILPLLRALQDKSLITRTITGNATRYTLLETLRDYAAEQETFTERTRSASLHAAHFRRMARQAEPLLVGPDSPRWLDALEEEHENLQAALDTLIAQKQFASALEMMVALGRYWERRGHARSGCQYLEATLPHGPKANSVRVAALRLHGQMRQMIGESEKAAVLYQESMALAESIGDRENLARGLVSLGHNHLTRSDYATARSMLLQGLVRCEEMADHFAMARCLHSLGSLHFAEGRWQEAEGYFQRSLKQIAPSGDRHSEARTLLNLGSVYSNFAPEKTLPIFHECLLIFEELRDTGYCSVVQQGIGCIALREGDRLTALQWFERSILAAQQVGWKDIEAISLLYMGDIRLMQGDFDAAEICYRQSLTQLVLDRERRRIAQALHAFARLAWRHGEAARAAWLFSAIDALCRAVGAVLESTLRPDHEAAIAEVRETLGAKEFARQWDAGQAASWEEAVAFAQAATTD